LCFPPAWTVSRYCDETDPNPLKILGRAMQTFCMRCILAMQAIKG
jgi:hypothetical protein